MPDRLPPTDVAIKPEPATLSPRIYSGVQGDEAMYYVYIMTNRRNGTLYIGVTNQIWRRVQEHREEINDGFTKKYALKRLVYYEVHGDVNKAIKREKTMKKWPRQWKLNVIESINPNWLDLYEFIHKQGNLLCIDPQSKSGRVLVTAKQQRKSKSKSALNRLDPGTSPG